MCLALRIQRLSLIQSSESALGSTTGAIRGSDLQG
jgi:hypothetical protein